MPLTYRLDDLGWFEFEKLTQALLKSRLAIGIEAWGGSGDWGRDAYFTGQLRYPTADLADGPFVFQCKFVEDANAAGADNDQLILSAAYKEKTRITERIKSNQWLKPPTHYAFFTNATLKPELRSKIIKIFNQVIPSSEVHLHDGEDLCGWLRSAPDLVRSCPQLLSLRELEMLLSDIVNAETISRSEAAIKLAKEQSKAFVPTEAYDLAQQKLQSHHFVILEGPPEMGKTTIGRLIALAQVCIGWDALEIRHPKEIYKSHKNQRKQVFIADDFFGRTEYDPTIVSEWQAELSLVIPMLDSTHWLILTSRSHLLEIAKSSLDIAGQNHRFPKLGEVVVNATALKDAEKARILYRHAKSVTMTTEQKALIKQKARAIIKNPHFTPERIRRLVKEVIPSLSLPQDHGDNVDSVITQAIDNPTHQMRISFRKLPDRHKWFLWALLDSSIHRRPLGTQSALIARYNRLCPHELHTPFEIVLEELDQSFIRKQESYSRSIIIGVDWVHPSCRDLAIEELSLNASARARFLSNCSEAGLLIATSIAGGAKGERQLPLLQLPSDWAAFEKRAKEIIIDEYQFAERLRGNFDSLLKLPAPSRLIIDACERIKTLFTNSLIPILTKKVGECAFDHGDALLILDHVATSIGVKPDLDLSESWSRCIQEVEAWSHNSTVIWEDNELVEKVAAFFSATKEHTPEWFNRANSTKIIKKIIAHLSVRVERETKTIYSYSQLDADALETASANYESLADALESIAAEDSIEADQKNALTKASKSYSSRASDLAYDLPGKDDDTPEYESTRTAEDVTIEDLFRDL